MKAMDGLVQFGEYGTVTVHLKEHLEARGITRYRMAKLAGTRFEVIDKWCSGKVERIDTDILARFCAILGCEVGELVRFEAAEALKTDGHE